MPVVQIYANDAFELLKKDNNSFLVDVRTPEEVNFVGFVEPNSINNRLIFLPWQTLPHMNLNADFGEKLEESIMAKSQVNSKLPHFKPSLNLIECKIIFICRSGSRSKQDANYSLNLGYKNCYNLAFGFEGELNNENQRGKINGWKASNLKWIQS